MNKAKKFVTVAILCMFALGSLAANENETPIDLKPSYPIGGFTPPSKAPAVAPSLFLDGHRLFWKQQHPEYTIYIVKDDVVKFTTYMKSEENELVLPDYLDGTYTIQLINGGLCWYGEIEL